jgi:hypothetical protein
MSGFNVSLISVLLTKFPVSLSMTGRWSLLVVVLMCVDRYSYAHTDTSYSYCYSYTYGYVLVIVVSAYPTTSESAIMEECIHRDVALLQTSFLWWRRGTTCRAIQYAFHCHRSLLVSGAVHLTLVVLSQTIEDRGCRRYKVPTRKQKPLHCCGVNVRARGGTIA